MATWSGMWLSNIVLIPIAVFLIVKALNDSQLFNKDYYIKIFRIIKQFAEKLRIRKTAGI
jgi:lipopolysaccharide export system permease protein